MRQRNQKRIAHTVLQELADLEQYPTKYKKLSYSSGLLSKVEVFDDDALTELLFTKDLTYSSGLLSQVLVTRERDSATATKSFTYTGSELTQIDVT